MELDIFKGFLKQILIHLIN